MQNLKVSTKLVYCWFITSLLKKYIILALRNWRNVFHNVDQFTIWLLCLFGYRLWHYMRQRNW